MNRRLMEEIARSSGSENRTCPFPNPAPPAHTHPVNAEYGIVFASVKTRSSRCLISNRLSLAVPLEMATY